MKLEEIMEVEKEHKGTYVGVRFTKATEKAINKFIQDNNIPAPDSIDDNGGLHVTLIFSRKVLEDFEPNKNFKTNAKVKGYKKLGKDKNCLVMELDAPAMVKRHKQIRKEHGATHDWDSYIPHITLSTEAKDFNEANLSEFNAPIKIHGEYSMPLDDD